MFLGSMILVVTIAMYLPVFIEQNKKPKRCDIHAWASHVDLDGNNEYIKCSVCQILPNAF